MREKPLYLANPDVCRIAFDATDYGILNTRFDMACQTHGDGDSFSWVAGGGSYLYSVRRLSRGFAKDDGSAVSCWEFTQIDSAKEIDTIYINTPELELLGISGDQPSNKLVNDVCNAAIDIAFELDALDAGLDFFITEDAEGNESLIPNLKKELDE